MLSNKVYKAINENRIFPIYKVMNIPSIIIDLRNIFGSH